MRYLNVLVTPIKSINQPLYFVAIRVYVKFYFAWGIKG